MTKVYKVYTKHEGGDWKEQHISFTRPSINHWSDPNYCVRIVDIDLPCSENIIEERMCNHDKQVRVCYCHTCYKPFKYGEPFYSFTEYFPDYDDNHAVEQNYWFCCKGCADEFFKEKAHKCTPKDGFSYQSIDWEWVSESELELDKLTYSPYQYKGEVKDRIAHIAQNWCLCMYCYLFRADLKPAYIQWRNDLENDLKHLNSLVIEKPKRKYLITQEALILDSDLDETEAVLNLCRHRFTQENENTERTLNINMDKQKEICSMFANKIEDLIACISSSDVLTYIRFLFPDDYTPIMS